VRRLLRYAEDWQRPAFPVTGKDLVRAGVEPGPEMGKRLKLMEERWIESGFALGREDLVKG
jgi:hypothetical protein